MIIRFVSRVPLIFKSTSPLRFQNEKVGRFAEGIASLYLRLKGYKIIRRRYQNPFGEIDLIAKRGHTLVFCEVKHRSTVEAGLYAIAPYQQSRIINGAKHFLFKNAKYAKNNMRFDALFTTETGLQHLTDAWQCNS